MTVSRDAQAPGQGHRKGSAEFRRITLALFAAALATFTTLYCVQAVLPDLARTFGLSPATASLAVSVGTGALAVAVVPLTALSEALGRTRVMTAAMFASAVLALAEAVSPSFEVLLVLRALQGVALAGLVAVAMSYLGEELHRESLGAGMGLYIAGNSIGGMAGRLVAGLVDDVANWRWALAVVGLLALVCAVVFRAAILPSRRFRARPLRVRALAASVGRALTDPGLLALYLVGFLLMGCFVTVYNYLDFRLLEPRFHLSQAVVGLIFVAYLAGSFSSTAAGRLVDRFGRRRMVWPAGVLTLVGIALMVPAQLAVVVLGLVITTAGFFAGHSVASGWVSSRSAALGVQGPAVYLFSYYAGSSVGGWAGGLAYGGAGWVGVSGYAAALVVAVIALGVGLRTLRPAWSGPVSG
ncbi:MFS transporter [Pseudonocardia acaciae]|uniref:MFS transporter n=1 Tax=Pseudonocardia acaciae TaxID=551276 RepID=UPI00048EBA1B|nr:MFS transporter [Pseudonocardia acaciae]